MGPVVIGIQEGQPRAVLKEAAAMARALQTELVCAHVQRPIPVMVFADEFPDAELVLMGVEDPVTPLPLWAAGCRCAQPVSRPVETAPGCLMPGASRARGRSPGTGEVRPPTGS